MSFFGKALAFLIAALLGLFCENDSGLFSESFFNERADDFLPHFNACQLAHRLHILCVGLIAFDAEDFAVCGGVCAVVS